MKRWICWDADHFGQNRHFLTRRNASRMHLFAGRLVFSISSPISPWYQLHEKPVAFPATAKIMIGHRLGHLNFTLYRKQRGPPNHGVNVNDTRFRAPFRQTRKLNDNDILQRRWAKYLRPRVENIYFFSSLFGHSRHSFSFSLSLSLRISFPFFPYFRLCSSSVPFPAQCIFCSVKILVNSNHDSRVLYV